MRILLALALVAACGKGKPTNQDPAPTGSAGSAGSAVARSGSGSAETPTAAPDVTLPASTGTPPNKAKALDAATLKKLMEMTFPGWTNKPMELTEKALIVRQVTATAPKLSVTVFARACAVDPTACLPMDPEKWKADAKFNDTLLGKLKGAPDTVFEVGATDLNGQQLVTSYVLGQSFQTDTSGNSPGTYKYAYGLHYNDGTNMIQVIAGYADMPLKTKEAMVQAIPRGDLEKAARAFLDAYTHAW